MIVGGPGSGKSTLARGLGAVTGLPVFHMDHIHYGPGWKQREPEVKTWMSEEVHRKPRWIFEGNHSRSYPQRMARAELMIWLDLPVGLRLWRVVRRQVRYLGKSRPDLPQGCTERLDRGALKFWLWIWRTRRMQRARLAESVAQAPATLTVIRLRSRREVARFLDSVEQGGWDGALQAGGGAENSPEAAPS